MTADMIYLETCLPDYFNGHGSHVYSVSPYGTCRDVKKALLDAIDQEELLLPDGESASDEHCDQLKVAVDELFSHVRDLDAVFDSMLEEPETEDAETPYSYFGVLWLEE